MAVDKNLIKKADRLLEMNKREEEKLAAMIAEYKAKLAKMKEASKRRDTEIEEIDKAAAAEYKAETDRYFILLGRSMAEACGAMPVAEYKDAMKSDVSVDEEFHRDGEFLTYFGGLLEKYFPDIDRSSFVKETTEAAAETETDTAEEAEALAAEPETAEPEAEEAEAEAPVTEAPAAEGLDGADDIDIVDLIGG